MVEVIWVFVFIWVLDILFYFGMFGGIVKWYDISNKVAF